MGEFEKNPQLKDHFDQVSEIVRKTVFSFIPAGPIFDSFWTYRTNLKQKRVIDFSESVKKAIEDINGSELHSANFETEDFVDLIEAIYIKVMTNESEFKLARFRNILLNQIIEPTRDTLKLKFVNILSQINDIQLIILENMKDIKSPSRVNFINIISWQETNIDANTININREFIPVKVGTNIVYTNSSEIDFFVSELVSLSVLEMIIEQKVSTERDDWAIGSEGGVIKDVYSLVVKYKITDIGKRFLEHLENS